MISIIIATYNGADTIVRTLEAISRLTPPQDGYEVIVVDNASTDDTAALVAGFEHRLPLTALHEARRGKAHALNTGIHAARGNILVFTDDDVIPDPDWLCAYQSAIEAHPEQRFFIGQVRHDWAAPPPRWLERLGAAGMSYGGTPIDRTEGAVSWLSAKGGNMAVTRYHMGLTRFRTDAATNFVGPGSGGEDNWFARDVSGGRVWYVPTARLKHMVRRHEIGVRPVFKRYVRIGMASYHLAQPDIDKLFDTCIFGIPVRVMGRLIRSAGGGLYRLARGDTEAAARRMLSFATDWGRLKSWQGMRTANSRQESTERPA